MTETITRKGEQTRERILDAALELFRERGFEEATMRAIAEAAGVAVGNAYYYFRAKEYLVQAFYERTHDEHLEASREILEGERDFEKRLLGVLRKKIDTAMPYHRLSGVLFRTAAIRATPSIPSATIRSRCGRDPRRCSRRCWRARTSR